MYIIKKYILIAFYAVFLIFPKIGFSDNTPIQQYRNYTPEQILSLSDEEKEKTPTIYLMVANFSTLPDSKIAIAMNLNTLMYPGISDYEKAIKLFQEDVGNEATGILTVWEIAELERRSKFQKLGTIGFPDKYRSAIYDSIAVIEGTSVILNDKIAFPVNHLKIICYKKRKLCESTQLILMTPREDSYLPSYNIFEMNKDFYNITRWEDGYIYAVSADNTGCRTYSLNYNFNEKFFFEVASNNNDCSFLGKDSPKLKKPLILQIVNGKQIIEEEFSKILKIAYSYLSSDFRKQIAETLKIEN